MATHDYNIINQSFPATRQDLNNLFTAVRSTNSAATAPNSPVDGELWFDTSTSLLKVYTGSVFEEVKSDTIITADIGGSQVTSAKIANNNVTADELHVTGDGSAVQYLRSDGDGSFLWKTPYDTRYTAGSGLDLAYSGATEDGLQHTGSLSVEPDLRDGITHVGRDTNDYLAFNTEDFAFYLNGNDVMQLQADGDLHVEASVVAYSSTVSDRNLKTAISNVEGALDKITKLNGVEFTRKDTGKRSAGVIAQDVEKVLPQAVVERTLPLSGRDGKYKTVEYDALHCLYIEAIKELNEKLDAQAKEIQELKNT